jgi:hypothetical protein
MARGVAWICGALFAFMALRTAHWYMTGKFLALPWWGHIAFILLIAVWAGLAWVIFTSGQPSAYVDPRRPSDARGPDQLR